MTSNAVTSDVVTKVETHVVEGGLRLNEPGAFEGYTMFSPYLATTTFLIDMKGEVVHQWETDYTPAGSAYLLDNGSLLRAADTENPRFRSNGTGGRLQLFDWDGNLLWDYLVSNDQQMQNHDLEPLPNGNVLVAAWDYRSREEAVAAGYDPARANAKGLWPCILLEIEPVPPDGGKVVWEWNAWDHLIQDFDDSKANYGDVAAPYGTSMRRSLRTPSNRNTTVTTAAPATATGNSMTRSSKAGKLGSSRPLMIAKVYPRTLR